MCWTMALNQTTLVLFISSQATDLYFHTVYTLQFVVRILRQQTFTVRHVATLSCLLVFGCTVISQK